MSNKAIKYNTILNLHKTKLALVNTGLAARLLRINNRLTKMIYFSTSQLIVIN